MARAVSFRIDRAYFERIESGSKNFEARAWRPYWIKVMNRRPQVAVFICGGDVHRRRITGVKVMKSAEEALGHPPNEREVVMLRLGKVIVFDLGDPI